MFHLAFLRWKPRNDALNVVTHLSHLSVTATPYLQNTLLSFITQFRTIIRGTFDTSEDGTLSPVQCCTNRWLFRQKIAHFLVFPTLQKGKGEKSARCPKIIDRPCSFLNNGFYDFLNNERLLSPYSFFHCLKFCDQTSTLALILDKTVSRLIVWELRARTNMFHVNQLRLAKLVTGRIVPYLVKFFRQISQIMLLAVCMLIYYTIGILYFRSVTSCHYVKIVTSCPQHCYMKPQHALGEE